uniref:Translation initiation factor IF-3, chloroplastic n=1 Tax=Gracilaria tenuistipitata var. liui TaxID=285951 RepID=IF3C_GRATL|nr:translation initiation factor 3 [Gracilaria tenuistipitata var. liui]Q6B8N5.1 RecName: Full=Translation initiation factor IF-3, chloroplastic [Gracilaria tenuistipitata var. liui]AAT79750.1 translation initiation factor 3 [Gracilaria tenuistipitata var. liui]
MLDKSKKERKRNEIEPLINERIKYSQIRLIDTSGSQLGIYSSSEALTIALNAGLDLVLISEKSNPPVCRIIDYGKYKFAQEKKAKEAKKKQHNVTIKEVKMRYKIDVHDYNVRINQAFRFLQGGDKVKANVIFRGREIQHTKLAIELLNKMAQDLSHISEIQQPPAKDGKNMIMILSPKKI